MLKNQFIYTFLQWTWGIIQNLAGFFVFLFLLIRNPKRKKGMFFNAFKIHWSNHFSTGLGMFIFYGHENAPDHEEVLVHEYGHTFQSCMLGPLYLFVVGLPSTLWAFLPCCIKYRKEKGVKYTDFYCEKWANNLGEKYTGLKAPNR